MEFARGASIVPVLVNLSAAVVRTVRPRQWTKNLIIYLALFFTVNEAWDPLDPGELWSLATKTTLAFLVFCALSGAIYIVNDIVDIERDRKHPRKRLRPIASGQLPIPLAWSAGFALVTVGLVSAFLLEPLFGGVSLVYVATMVAYSLLLKELILLDVFAISAGFVLRAVAGAAVLSLPISPWLFICTGLGALFLALAKRRGELAQAGDAAASQRGTLEIYSPEVLNQFIGVVATSVLIAYSLYTFTAPNLPENHSMMLTIPFVVYGLFRYMYLVHRKGLGENPEDIVITDAPLMATIVLWLATAAAILVVFRG